ncbi:protein kinase domain-containing protein [Falsarthrobacter nasiphocae]|uniref:Serine/threonine protein kinase n=1 Tax=Falsarthrobacter nasiphocae TaxID=189863 RepID=A0AAE3YCB4_9MICC|nr:protein kinase [Falsarthrobacter nasiphocae]MDR6891288.1 serine/threonine protein kinase [Falsarthrobacter nasiphocae]
MTAGGLALRLAPGGTVEARNGLLRLTPGEVLRIILDVAEGLTALHRAGFVHGDLHPGNILLDADGRAVVGDLGSARRIGDTAAPRWAADGFLPAAPGDGPADDVYGLGALAWRLAVGAVPGPEASRPPLAAVLPSLARLSRLVDDSLADDARRRPGLEAWRRAAARGAATRVAGVGWAGVPQASSSFTTEPLPAPGERRRER